jgi:hypothetical protein
MKKVIIYRDGLWWEVSADDDEGISPKCKFVTVHHAMEYAKRLANQLDAEVIMDTVEKRPVS